MTRKTLIILLILILAIAGVGFWLLKPGFSELKNLRVGISTANEELARKETLLAKIKALEEKYEESKEKIEKMYQVLPLKPDIPGILVQLETLASENGLLLEKIGYTLPKEATKVFRPQTQDEAEKTKEQPLLFKTVIINLQVAGSYEAFKSFLGALENNLRIMDVSGITLSAREKEGSVSYSYNLNLSTYYQE